MPFLPLTCNLLQQTQTTINIEITNSTNTTFTQSLKNDLNNLQSFINQNCNEQIPIDPIIILLSTMTTFFGIISISVFIFFCFRKKIIKMKERVNQLRNPTVFVTSNVEYTNNAMEDIIISQNSQQNGVFQLNIIET